MEKTMYILALILMFNACSIESFDIENVTPADFSGIAGRITDDTGNPIEHIMVTISIEDKKIVSAYTSSSGVFLIPIEYKIYVGKCINLLIEDIDGEENGGLYQTKTDIIQADSNPDRKFRISLDYRLTLANASECTPQS